MYISVVRNNLNKGIKMKAVTKSLETSITLNAVMMSIIITITLFGAISAHASF